MPMTAPGRVSRFVMEAEKLPGLGTFGELGGGGDDDDGRRSLIRRRSHARRGTAAMHVAADQEASSCR